MILENETPVREQVLTKLTDKSLGNKTNEKIKILEELKKEFKVIFIDKVKEEPSYNLLSEEHKKELIKFQNALIDFFDIKIRTEKINLLKKEKGSK
jgi:hypothetical protein